MWFDKGYDSPVSDYEDIQKAAVKIANDGDVFVEVGSFVGEGLACLIDQVRASKKKIDIYSVDLFDIETMILDGDHRKPEDPIPTLDDPINDNGLTSRQWMEAMGPRCMLAEFYNNLAYNDRDKYLTGTLVGSTSKLASRFADGSVRFCFLDASHSYEGFKADLEAWYPKVSDDGIFAGHDWFSSPSIRRAVTEFAKNHWLKVGLGKSSWILAKPQDFSYESPK